MNIPKGLIQKLGVFKSKSALLVPIGIGLIAVLLFIPTQLMSSRLKKQMEDESVSKRGKQVRSLGTSAVSSEQWKEEAERQRSYASDANEAALLSIQSSQRKLLSYKVLPRPVDTSTLLFKEFGQLYRRGIEGLISRINAHDCPTEVELQRALENSPGSSRSGRRSTVALGGGASGISRMRLGEVESKIVDEVCRGRAESMSVYASPIDLSGYEYWGEYQYDVGMEKAVEDCWYYQLAYWIIEDVIDTIRVCNAGSSSVLNSPVKRLLSVNFDLGQGISVGVRSKGQKTTASSDRPVYVLSLENIRIEPCTQRVSNDDIDVVHFDIIVVVSSEAVLSFMKQLCSAKEHQFAGFDGSEPERTFRHNQITILEDKIRSIDHEEAAHRFYRYGEDAVVELDLVCEYIFNKKGYDGVKPESVKNAFKATSGSKRR